MDILEHWVNSIRHCGGALGIREEVGQTRDDAGSRLGTDLLQRRGEDRHVAAGQGLSRLQRRICATTVLVDMLTNVHISNQGENWCHFHELANFSFSFREILVVEIFVCSIVETAELLCLCFTRASF